MLFSGKMLESNNYMASVEKGELVPQLTLNAFVDKEHDWNILEEGQIMAGVNLDFFNFANNLNNDKKQSFSFTFHISEIFDYLV